MNRDIRRFIETNIEFINHEEFAMLYNQAYDWLTDWQCADLTDILTAALAIDLTDTIKDCLMQTVYAELKNAKSRGHFDTPLNLSSFVRMYLNNLLGMPWDNFVKEVEQLIHNNPDLNLKTIADSNNDVIITMRRKR